MCNWMKWLWPGLITTFLLTLLASWLAAPHIEDDLSAKAGQDLNSAGQEWANVALNGRDLTLSGIAPTEADRSNALEIAANAHDVRVVDNQAGILPTQSPYSFSASLTSGNVVLEGYTPNEGMKAKIGEMAKSLAGDGSVSNNLQLAGGQSQAFEDKANYAIGALKGLANGNSGFSGDSFSISGLTASLSDYEKVTASLSAQLPGDMKLAQSDILAPAVSPYIWAATKSADGVKLTGYVPNEDARKNLLDSVTSAMSDSFVEDAMFLASGEPATYSAGTKFALEQLASLKSGSAIITNSTLGISGVAENQTNMEAVKSAIASGLPDGLTLADIDISAPVAIPEPKPEPAPEPEVKVAEEEKPKPIETKNGFESWSLSRVDNNVTLSGDVPSAQSMERNVELVRLGFGRNIVIDDKQELAEGAPDVYADLMATAIQLASRMSNASVEISGNNMLITGRALSDTAAKAIKAKVENALPSGFDGNAEVEIQDVDSSLMVDVNVCQTLVDEIMADNTILFQSAKADLRALSSGVLDRIIFTGRRCPLAKIVVEGHTDSVGADDFNQILSESRAQAVKKFLQANGILDTRVTAIGLGETQPIADNASEEGKAKNRRIEFKITE